MTNFLLIAPLITFFSSILVWIMVAGVVFLWIPLGKIGKRVAIKAGIASSLSWILAHIAKLFIEIQRPYIVNGSTALSLFPGMDSSFPSGHTAFAFGMATVIFQKNRKLGIIYLAGSTLIGVARIFGGLHYWPDVLAGAILGVVVGLSVERIGGTQ